MKMEINVNVNVAQSQPPVKDLLSPKRVFNKTILKKNKLHYNKNDQDEYVCSHCEFVSKNQSTMHYHLKKHDGPLPHPCKHCDARFLQKSLLDLHIRARHSETLEKKDMFKCPCNNCDYQDIRKGNRNIHFIRIHLRDVLDKLNDTPTEPNCTIACKECRQNFKSMTQFFYHALGCVKVDSGHEYYDQWMSIKNISTE